MMRPCAFTLCSALLIVGVLACPAAATGSTSPLDLPAYSAELNRWSALIDRLRENPAEAASLRRQLPGHWFIVVNKQRFTVSTQWLADGLDRIATHPELAVETSRQVSVRLQAMLGDAEGLALAGATSDNRARTTLDHILQLREFRGVHAASAEDSLWDQLTDWIWKVITRLLDRVGGHPTATKAVLWGVVMALGLVFLGWLIYALANLSFADIWQRRIQPSSPPATTAISWRELLQQSRAVAGQGDYREAVRIVYGAAVQRIAEEGTWQLDPARTHREYVRLLPANSSQRSPLMAIAACFERVWYGNAQASAADFESVRAELESMP